MPFSPQTMKNTADFEHFCIIQLSDLHIDDAQISGTLFDRVMADLCHPLHTIDLVVVTGDLVQVIDNATYEAIFAKLDSLAIPYVCIAGNHDVTQELDSHLPFEQRRHIPMLPHPRLVNKHSITTPHWQLLFCDSTVSGEIYGTFSEDTLAWLAEQLRMADKPCILFCHHHILPIHSAWLDGHITKNYPALWQVIEQFPHKLAAVFTGHVHQEHNQVYQGVAVYTVPSLSEQFLPFCDTFAIDVDSKVGYRWITLYNNGKLATGIKRMDTTTPC